MMTRDELEALLKEHGARIRPKEASRFMRILGWLLRPLGNDTFMENYWTTIGRTIYHPERVTEPYRYPQTIRHELVHVRQWLDYNVLYAASYLLFPLPVGLAYFRWKWEREAYMVNIRDLADPRAEIERVTDNLWHDYAWTWPRKWMRRWFWDEWARQRKSRRA